MAKDRTIKLISLGCSKNLVDSEVLLKQMTENGFVLLAEDDKEYADVVVINTCGFIKDAKVESIDTIIDYVKARQEGRIGELIVTGCMAERYKDDLITELPEVDGFFGVNDMHGILRKLKADFYDNMLDERVLSGPGHYAYLKISEGCGRECSFCAIPQIRGPYVSKPVETIVKEAELLAVQGVKELLVVAQDLSWYGVDIYKKQALAELTEKLANVQGIDWIRLHYAYPAGFPIEVMNVMRKYDNVCNYIDIPFQHINDRLLKCMRRGHTRKSTIELLDMLKDKVPGIAIRTTLMVGYPGETEKEYNELLQFVEEGRFDRMGAFAYSHEEDTHAWQNLEDSVDEKVKNDRLDIIMETQQEISLDRNEALMGKSMKVIVDKLDDEFYYARSEHDSPEVDNEVLIPAEDRSLTIGEMYMVKIIDYEEFDLYAVPVEE